MELVAESVQAFRALRRRPGVVALAVFALGLGIGLPAAIYSVAEASFLRGLPVEAGNRILHLERRPLGASGEGWGVAPRDFQAWQEAQRSFEPLGAFQFATVTLRDAAGADRYNAARVTANAFDILRVRPLLGRAFAEDDDDPGAAPVAVLGHIIWRDRYGSDPGILGRTAFIDGIAHTVVGVMPDGFRFPTGEDLWVPLVIPPAAAADDEFGRFDVFGRLSPGVSRADAMADMSLIAARVAEQWPETNRTMGVAVKPYTARFMGENATRQAFVMLGAVLLVLLVASVNVANLQLVRVVERLRDLAVRTAMGASRGRIMRQMMLESGVVAVLGGIVGIGVTGIAIRGFDTLFPPHRMPFWFDLRLDLPVLLFVGALSLAAAFMAGVLPAVKASGRNLIEALNDESRGSTGLRVGRLMQALVVFEIAFSLALLVTAGLLLLGVTNVQPDRLGMDVDDVVTAGITVPDTWDEDRRIAYWDGLLTTMKEEPGVRDVALATDLPATHASYQRFTIEGVEYAPDASLPGARYVAASEGLWRLLGRDVVRGSGFPAGTAATGLPVVLVNQRFVQVHFQGEDPIGRRIRPGGAEDADWRTIVGIVPDLWINGLDASPDRNPPGMYVPIQQAPPLSASIAIRARTDPAAVVAALRSVAFGLDPDVPIYDAMTMVRLIEDNSWFFGMAASILIVAGLAALVLATVGLYGVIAFSVGRRTREIGIRMAFGATGGRILRLVLRRGAPAVAIGMLVGFALAFVLARGVSGLMFGVKPDDPRVFAVVGLFLAAVALVAMLVPANRAANAHPLEALRTE